MQDKLSFVYILTNYTNTVLYTGSTGVNLKERIWQHKEKVVKSFTARYNVSKLVYYEVFGDLYLALEREKQIKAGSRAKKIKLIENMNPEWKDLYDSLD
jgi:putative endonuclease